MKTRILVALLICLLAFPAFTAGADDDKPYAGTTITVCNWYDYIDPAVIELFEEETGIKVDYVYFSTNEDLYTKLTTGAGVFDVIFPSEYLIERLMNEGLLAEINHENVPNFAGVMDWMQDPTYDPGCRHSIPYMWGTVGILVNTDLVDEEITSWSSLFDEKYAGDIIMMKSMRDTIAIGLIMSGYSINTRDEDELEAARELLVEQKSEGIVGAYMLDETKDKMIQGSAALAVLYSGDAIYAIEGSEGNLVYVVPEEGSNIWVDGMCIPASSKNKEAAEIFIDFMCRPDIAQMNQEYIYYSTPIQAAADAWDPEDPIYYAINPSGEIIDRCEFFTDVSDMNDVYSEIWMDIMMS